MSHSDSEDFESADEETHDEKALRKERKKRQSSSNYGSAPETEESVQKPSSAAKVGQEIKSEKKDQEGWDDFEIQSQADNSTLTTKLDPPKPAPKAPSNPPQTNIQPKSKPSTISKPKDLGSDDKDSVKDAEGWDTFDDWGDDTSNDEILKPQPTTTTPKTQDISSVADRLASSSIGREKTTNSKEFEKTTSPPSSGWGWGGWGVDMGAIVSSASAGLSTIGNHVSQGISTVLETGIGAPDPEELARINKQASTVEGRRQDPGVESAEDVAKGAGGERVEGFIPFGSLISGVTKFVETTGTRVIHGGLDTLESIGKKTMEVLQDGDPGLSKKRALFGLEGDKPVLSQVLREAKSRADVEDKVREDKREAKEVHYETLFDDFEGLLVAVGYQKRRIGHAGVQGGLVHLEALEMLSKQVSMRIEERLRSGDAEKRQEIKETLQQVSELCEMPEDDDDDEDEEDPKAVDGDSFHQRLQEATQELGLKLQFHALVKHFSDSLNWLKETDDACTEKAIYKQAVSSLAQYTALSMELYHKAGEMLLVKTRRSTADEADGLTQLTVVLTKHISELATQYTVKLNSIASANKDQINNYVTNVFLEAGNSSTYIQNAFQLALPLLQIGAV